VTNYVITVRGAAGPTVRSVLADLDLSVEEDVTVLRADLVDTAAFNGLVRQLQDLGIEIMEIRREPRPGHG
jgi:hypothetical protein